MTDCMNGHPRQPGEYLHGIDTPQGRRFVCHQCWTIGGLLECNLH